MKLYVITIVLPALLSLNSWALPTPAARRLPDWLVHRIKIRLTRDVKDTKEEMQRAYPFICASTQTEHPSIDFGLHIRHSKTCSDMQETERLSTLYRQLKIFLGPVELVSTSTSNAMSKQLKYSVVQTTWSLRSAIDATVAYMNQKKMSIPSVKNVDESLMNSTTTTYLTKLQVTVSPDVVANYRNYVIIYVLHDVLENSIRNCIPQIKRQQ